MTALIIIAAFAATYATLTVAHRFHIRRWSRHLGMDRWPHESWGRFRARVVDRARSTGLLS